MGAVEIAEFLTRLAIVGQVTRVNTRGQVELSPAPIRSSIVDRHAKARSAEQVLDRRSAVKDYRTFAAYDGFATIDG